ncbi:MAG TPA: EscU/YscU/HrcU family type III secretion system export apparatus switch protein [Labilithrix sp.]|nr:EscU/YscU/HrcU family type III secretion system export apparatus switch protein [Labilithrix sp.]
MSADTGDRTYDPSDQRKEEFRKQGRFAKARDAGGIVATAAVIAVIAGSQADISEASRRLMSRTLGDLGALERLGPAQIISAAGLDLAALSATAVLAAMAASVVIGAAQARFRTYGELLTPDLARLDPMKGLGRFFSPKRAASETFVAIGRVVAVGAVAWHALSKELPLMVALSRMPLSGSVPVMVAALGRIVGMITGALVLVAAVDYGQSFYTTSRDMKMTRKEREDESKQSEGDPKAKAKMKARAKALARKRALNAVKNADVIVTNPTHVAVALRYGPKDPAPVVIAKGHDEVALRIRAEARKHGIPILENRRLARALDAEVAIGKQVPAAHFAAVARVLAFVYRLRGRGRAKVARR